MIDERSQVTYVVCCVSYVNSAVDAEHVHSVVRGALCCEVYISEFSLVVDHVVDVAEYIFV